MGVAVLSRLCDGFSLWSLEFNPGDFMVDEMLL
jgi:hypothetical protein